MRKASFILALAIILGTLLVAFPALPAGIAHSLIPTASAHALPVRSDPASDAILQAPPSRVRMWFSEDLNPYTSRIVVVDPTNRQVDNKDSQVASDNSREMFVDLPLLPAGTYIVAWRTQSAADGHIVGGSYIFRIARPDGSLPPLPSVLPTGNIPGAGGSGAQASGTLDGPTTFQAITTWLALLFMTFWVGGLIWQTWVLPPTSGDGSRDPDLTTAPRAAAERFSRLAPIALMLILVADVGIVLGQSAALAG
ncbi:MAG: copper resistance CopC family protein, partial [Ktedonobacterales bacterium]